MKIKVIDCDFSVCKISDISNVNFNDETVKDIIKKVREEKYRIAPNCLTCASPCGHNADYDMKKLWEDEEDIRSLKSLILFGLRGMAAYAYHAMVLGYMDQEVNNFFYKGLYVVGEDWTKEEYLQLALETGRVNLKCMELLDKANTETFGTPQPDKVS